VWKSHLRSSGPAGSRSSPSFGSLVPAAAARPAKGKHATRPSGLGRLLTRWLTLLPLALLSFAACATVGTGDVPECPTWPEAAIEDLERVEASGEFPYLVTAVGTQELHCEALEAWNGSRPKPCAQGVRGWAQMLLALECSRR